MMTKREILKSFAETGNCPSYFDCGDCPYKRRCYKLQAIFRKIGARELLKRFPEKRKFDKSKILTCVTASQAKIGSKGYFADDLTELRIKFNNNELYELLTVYAEDCTYRFSNERNEYAIFYPVEED